MEEITAEYATETLVKAPELRVVPKVTVACKTDLGRVRENNEDKFEYYLPEDERELASRGLVFVVCDGMGGHEAGQIASELSCKTFLHEYLNHPSFEPSVALESAVRAANRLVLDIARSIPSRRGMGTTLSALALLQDFAWIAHVGDTRIYRVRDAALELLTVDHTWVEEALRTGLIGPDEVNTHPHRHVLQRAIGTEDSLLVDVFQTDLRQGDLFLLCSDGLMNHVPDERIEEVLTESAPSEACWRLVGDALVGGGSDNTTVIVVRVDSLDLVEP